MKSNDIHIHFTLEKEIGITVILKKHAETLSSIFNEILKCLKSAGSLSDKQYKKIKTV